MTIKNKKFSISTVPYKVAILACVELACYGIHQTPNKYMDKS